MNNINKYLMYLEKDIEPLLESISNHKVFIEIFSVENLKIFAEHHVYAVWDFMCLVKSLQRKLVCTEIAWYPPINHVGCHVINEIVAEEESDITWDGRYLSHFEMYLESMQECGAKIDTILALIDSIKRKEPLEKALSEHPIPKISKDFICDTFKIIKMEVHQIAASFTFAREGITDRMFLPILQNMKDKASVGKFMYYFQRHIDLDVGKHSQEAKLLIVNLCGNDERKWHEAKEASKHSLRSRINFLDGVYQEIKQGN
jgi:hypothetical protein